MIRLFRFFFLVIYRKYWKYRCTCFLRSELKLFLINRNSPGVLIYLRVHIDMHPIYICTHIHFHAHKCSQFPTRLGRSICCARIVAVTSQHPSTVAIQLQLQHQLPYSLYCKGVSCSEMHTII